MQYSESPVLGWMEWAVISEEEDNDKDQNMVDEDVIRRKCN